MWRSSNEKTFCGLFFVYPSFPCCLRKSEHNPDRRRNTWKSSAFRVFAKHSSDHYYNHAESNLDYSSTHYYRTNNTAKNLPYRVHNSHREAIPLQEHLRREEFICCGTGSGYRPRIHAVKEMFWMGYIDTFVKLAQPPFIMWYKPPCNRSNKITKGQR